MEPTGERGEVVGHRVSEIPSLKEVRTDPIDQDLLGEGGRMGLETLRDKSISEVAEGIRPRLQGRPLFGVETNDEGVAVGWVMNKGIINYAVKYEDKNNSARDTYMDAEEKSDGQMIAGLACVATGEYRGRRDYAELLSRGILNEVVRREDLELFTPIYDVYFNVLHDTGEIGDRNDFTPLIDVVRDQHGNHWVEPEEFVEKTYVQDMSQLWKSKATEILGKFDRGEEISVEDIKAVEIMFHLFDKEDLLSQVKGKLEDLAPADTAEAEVEPPSPAIPEGGDKPKSALELITEQRLTDENWVKKTFEGTPLWGAVNQIIRRVKEGRVDDDWLRKIEGKLEDDELGGGEVAEKATILLAVLSGVGALRNLNAETVRDESSHVPEKPKDSSKMTFEEIDSEMSSFLDRLNTLGLDEKGRLDELAGEQRKLWENARSAGIASEVERLVETTLRGSTWDNYSIKLSEFGNRYEEILMNGVPAYRDNPRLHGLVKGATRNVSTQVRYQGLEAIKNDPAKVQELKETINSIDALSQKIPYLKIIDLGPGGAHSLIPKRPDASAAAGSSAYEKAMLEEAEKQTAHAERAADEAEKARQAQEAQADMMRRSYGDLYHTIVGRAFENPIEYKRSRPHWYQNELSHQQRDAVDALLEINLLAHVKEKGATANLDAWTEHMGNAAVLRKEGLKNLWEHQPGFREALATIIEEVFEKEDFFKLSSAGVARLETPTTRKTYLDSVTNRLTQKFVDENRSLVDYGKLSHKQLAELAVAAADNLLFSTGAYDSADPDRKIKSGNLSVMSEQVRTLMHPRVKLEGKLKIASGAASSEYDNFGGQLGDYTNSLFRRKDPGFIRRSLRGGDYRSENRTDYAPKRMLRSILELTTKNPADGNTESLATTMLRNNKTPDAHGLYDFGGGVGALDFDTNYADEFYGSNIDQVLAPIAIYRHILGKDPNKRLSLSGLYDQVGNMLKRKATKDYYSGPGSRRFFEAMIIMAFAPEGPLQGESRILNPKIEEKDYNSAVERVVSGSRDLRRIMGLSNYTDDQIRELLFAGSHGDQDKRKAARNRGAYPR